jgi:hypothetical protein
MPAGSAHPALTNDNPHGFQYAGAQTPSPRVINGLSLKTITSKGKFGLAQSLELAIFNSQGALHTYCSIWTGDDKEAN